MCGLSINSSPSGVITGREWEQTSWLTEGILLFSIKTCEAIRETVHLYNCQILIPLYHSWCYQRKCLCIMKMAGYMILQELQVWCEFHKLMKYRIQNLVAVGNILLNYQRQPKSKKLLETVGIKVVLNYFSEAWVYNLWNPCLYNQVLWPSSLCLLPYAERALLMW